MGELVEEGLRHPQSQLGDVCTPMRRAKCLAVRTVVALAFAIKVHISVFLTIFHFTSSLHDYILRLIRHNDNLVKKLYLCEKMRKTPEGRCSPDFLESACILHAFCTGLTGTFVFGQKKTHLPVVSEG